MDLVQITLYLRRVFLMEHTSMRCTFISALVFPRGKSLEPEISIRIGDGSYYDYMPFLLVDAPFDNASNELIGKFDSRFSSDSS